MKSRYILLNIILFTLPVLAHAQIKITNIEMAYPYWKPDGSSIIFQANWNGNWDIFEMDRDGANLKQLTFDKTNEFTPAVSPDGKQIAYVSDESGNNEIYVMSIEGGEKTRITNSPGDDIHPFWHPVENMIVFNSDRTSADNYELYEFHLLSKKLVRLTTNDITETYASWSPDGSNLAYVKWENGAGNIYIMDTNSKKETRLTNHEKFDGWPHWINNNEIAFASFRTNPAQIFKINIRTLELVQLTNSDEENARPNVWNNQMLYNGMKNGTMNIYMLDLK